MSRARARADWKVHGHLLDVGFGHVTYICQREGVWTPSRSSFAQTMSSCPKSATLPLRAYCDVKPLRAGLAFLRAGRAHIRFSHQRSGSHISNSKLLILTWTNILIVNILISLKNHGPKCGWHKPVARARGRPNPLRFGS